MSEHIVKHDFFETGRKIQLWGTLITCLGFLIISTGILTRMIFTPIPPITPDYIRVYIISSIILTITGFTINYYGLKWIKNQAQQTKKQLQKQKQTQKWTEIQKTFNEYTDHYGNQLLKGGISFASIGILTFSYAWVALHHLLRKYTDFDVYLSLIIVVACLITTATLLAYGQYWKNRAQKNDII
ncbi:MAG: hypothetical protein ACUVXA_00680 [Candidatus Jordarchaeum sp.]|uniref:hypothetical protein n=1 Tax=Candidatus Jordarchaeum sp. TaxID=2823881 RepID=UPI0040496E18